MKAYLYRALATVLLFILGIGTCYAQALSTYNSTNVWLPSATRTTGVVGADTVTPNARGIIVRCNVTAVTTLQSLQIIVEGWDPASNTYYTVAQNTATGTTGMIVIRLSPSYTSVVGTILGITVNDYLPYTWRLRTVQSGGSFTYSCSYDLFAVT